VGRAQSLRWEDVGPQIIMQLVCTVPRRLADNLPAATVFRNLKTGELQYEDGFKIGFTHQGKVLLNNHLTIIIKFHRVKRPEGEVYRIVGFEVDPRTVSSESLQRIKEPKCAFPSDAKVMELHKGSKSSSLLFLPFRPSVSTTPHQDSNCLHYPTFLRAPTETTSSPLYF